MITLLRNLTTRVSERKCRESLWHFYRAMWPIIEPGQVFVDAWYIGAIAEHLEAFTAGQITHLIISIGPGYGKSTFVSVGWPAWEWIDKPAERTLFGSYDKGLALRDAVKSRDIINSEWYQETFRPDWGWARDQAAKGLYKNTRSGVRYSFGMHSRLTTGWRGNKLVIDDALSAKSKYDTIVKSEIKHTFDHVLTSRVNPDKPRFMLIGQRIAYDDLIGHLIEKGNYELLTLPSRYDPARKARTCIHWSDPRETPQEPLNPARFPEKVLERIENEEMGTEEFEGQHQQNPGREGGAKFRKEWFQYYYYPDRSDNRIIALVNRNGIEEIIRLDQLDTFVSVDPAGSIKQTADFTVMPTWAIGIRRSLILLDRVKERIEGPEILARTKKMYATPNVAHRKHVKFAFESNGVGLHTGQNMIAAGVPVELIHVSQDKLITSTTARVMYQTGRVYHPRPSDQRWIMDYEQNLIEFPGGAHDDDVSAVSIAAIALANIGGTIAGSSSAAKPTETPKEIERRVSARGSGSRSPYGNR